jgi:hypothetical protein
LLIEKELLKTGFFTGSTYRNIIQDMNSPILIPPIQHNASTKKPLSPSQHKLQNSLNQKTKQPHNQPWDEENPTGPIPTKNKKHSKIELNGCQFFSLRKTTLN